MYGQLHLVRRCPSQEPAGTEPAANGADAPAETKPTLSANDITLDSEGDTQQITVTGASGEVTWTSSDTKHRTVTADGTITAVAPGRGHRDPPRWGTKPSTVRCAAFGEEGPP